MSDGMSGSIVDLFTEEESVGYLLAGEASLIRRFSLANRFGHDGGPSVWVDGDGWQHISAIVTARDLLPRRVIRHPNGEPYITRWYVGGLFEGEDGWGDKSARPPRKPGACGVYLHQIHTPDWSAPTHLHNHPWTHAVSYLIRGGYIERALENGEISSVERTEGTVNSLSTKFHRIESLIGSEVLTLLLVGHKRGTGWGFYVPSGDYIEQAWMPEARASQSADSIRESTRG